MKLKNLKWMCKIFNVCPSFHLLDGRNAIFCDSLLNMFKEKVMEIGTQTVIKKKEVKKYTRLESTVLMLSKNGIKMYHY